MSIPTGPWTIRTKGCDLKTDDVLTISGSNLLVTGQADPWGTITGWDGPNKALVNSGGVPHKVIYTAGTPKSSLICIYPGGTSTLPVEARAHEHVHRPGDGEGHTGGTAISWTADDGG